MSTPIIKSIVLHSFILHLISSSIIAQVYISTDSAINDIDKLIKNFEKIHYNPYFKITKHDFDSIKNNQLSNWEKDSISLKKFMVTGMKLTALLSGGHSYMDWQNPKMIPEMTSHNYIPFTGKIDDENRFIVTNSTIPEIKVGDRIESINKYNITRLYRECMSYTGGIESFKNACIEKVFPLYLFFNDKLQAPYVIKKENTKMMVNSTGMSIEELIEFVNSSGQVQVDYSFTVLEGKIGLISYNSCNDHEKFKKFLEETFETIANNKIEKIIIDIRKNGGGNSSLNDLLLSYITKKPYRQSSGRYWKVSEQSKKAYASNDTYVKLFGEDFMDQYMKTPNQNIIEAFDNELTHPVLPKNYYKGKSCILIGPTTFSSANFLADAVKTYQITTLIGSSTGEYTNDFGEQLSFKLPNSGSIVYVSSTFDIGANGDKSRLEPVHPDIEVKTNPLEFAIEWIKR